MPFLLPFLHLLAAALLWIDLGTAQTPPPTTPTPAMPVFAGHNAAWWDEQLQNDLAARELLAINATKAMPLLRWLLDHGNEYARYSAAAALTRLGPAAKPMWDVLFTRLRDSKGHWPDNECARALAAIGDDRDDLRELLLRHITRSTNINLRTACGEALATLRRDVGELLLGAVATGAFVDEAWAIEALMARGERVVPALLAALDATGARGDVAREALVQQGWPVANRLEAAGHGELAQRALTEGLLRGVLGADEHERAPLDPEPPAQHLPELLVSSSFGHGNHLSVWRGVESARGYQLREVHLEFVNGDEEGEGQWQLSCREATVPRALALGMTRQLTLLARFELKPRAPSNRSRRSSGNFAALVRATTAGKRWFDASFVGYPSSRNTLQRYRAEAARTVMWQLAGFGDWRNATPDDADRAAVTACHEHFGNDGWLGERFAALEELLKR